MSCNDPCESLLSEIQDVIRDSLTDLSNSGMLIYGVYEVQLVKNIYGEDLSYLGKPREIIEIVKTEIIPKPRVEVNTKFYVNGEIVIKEGRAKITQIIASDSAGKDFTREQLEGADYWLIDGSPYSLVKGSLKRLSNGVFWEAMLDRRQFNGVIKT